jgi:hypothetical protein
MPIISVLVGFPSAPIGTPCHWILRHRIKVVTHAGAGSRFGADSQISFNEAYEDTVEAGAENYALKRLRKFREWLVTSETEDDLLESPKQIRDKMLFKI